MDQIPKQVRLPLRVASAVAVQGIRIRLGRSAVTLSGIALGIAFLTSILVGAATKRGFSAEDEMRREVIRMLGFLTAETGPLDQRTIGLVITGSLSETERRLLRRLEQEGVTRFQVAGETPPGIWRRLLHTDVTDPRQVGGEASGVIILGDGATPNLDWETVLANAHRPVLALSRAEATLPEGVRGLVRLSRAPRPEELETRAAAETRERYRRNWILAVSLLVTVMGISNAMLMSVTERFREIGTMKCLGALSAFIRQQFLIESAMLGFAGSVAGVLFGGLVAYLYAALSYGPAMAIIALRGEIAFLAMAIPLAFAVGIILSIVAAIYPATVASRMVPADALRSNV